MTEQEISELEAFSRLLAQLIRVCKGEEQDMTGFGMWRIFCDGVQRVTGQRLITEEQWEEYVQLSEAARKEKP